MMINHVFIPFSTVLIYDIFIYSLTLWTLRHLHNDDNGDNDDNDDNDDSDDNNNNDDDDDKYMAKTRGI